MGPLAGESALQLVAGTESADAAQRSGLQLLRSRGRIRGIVALLGPAFVAAVAYIDPGNFATNFSAGAKFGYTLVWVIVVANLMAMLVQYLSAKTGVATGRDLPELCREHFPRAVSGRADHGGGRVRDPGPRATRLPPFRAGDRRPARDRLPRVRLRPGHRGC